jgi:TatA/E family protein of Tat protein translocase
MGNLGAGEILFIAIFALLVFGPRRLPEIGRSVGKALAELRKATNELKDGFTSGFEDFGDLKSDLRELRNIKDFGGPLILNGPVKATRVTPQTPPAEMPAPTPPSSDTPPSTPATPATPATPSTPATPATPAPPTLGHGASPSDAGPAVDPSNPGAPGEDEATTS